MRAYRLGRRQAAVDRTRERIVAAAREVLASGAPLSVGAVARRAEVSRITVYNRFGSRAALLTALAAPPTALPATAEGDPGDQVRGLFGGSCARWAADPALFRHLATPPDRVLTDTVRRLAEQLAEKDLLRPGCSIKEAEDVLTMLMAFPVFDQLHRDGRRTAAAVAEILVRLAGGVLA